MLKPYRKFFLPLTLGVVLLSACGGQASPGSSASSGGTSPSTLASSSPSTGMPLGSNTMGASPSVTVNSTAVDAALGYHEGAQVDPKAWYAKVATAQKALTSLTVQASTPSHGEEASTYDFSGSTPKVLTSVTVNGTEQQLLTQDKKVYLQQGSKWTELTTVKSGSGGIPFIIGGLFTSEASIKSLVYKGQGVFEAQVLNPATKKTVPATFTVDAQGNVTQVEVPSVHMTVKQSHFNAPVKLPTVK